MPRTNATAHARIPRLAAEGRLEGGLQIALVLLKATSLFYECDDPVVSAIHAPCAAP